MLRDANELTALGQYLYRDVVIIGAGLAGLVLATKLQTAGVKVAVLESGGFEADAEIETLNQVHFTHARLSSASDGRQRLVGGNSNRWGGRLIPLEPHIIAERAYAGIPGWPISLGELEQYTRTVEDLFSLPHGRYDTAAYRSSNEAYRDSVFAMRYAKIPSFFAKNLARRLVRELARHPDADLCYRGTVVGFQMDEFNHVTAVKVSTKSGTFSVRGRQFALCAGALESTRLLLQLRETAGIDFSSALGAFLHDHLSARVHEVLPSNAHMISAVGGPSIEKGAMREPRYELSSASQLEDGVVGAYGYVDMLSQSVGFDGIRRTMRAIQGGSADVAALIMTMKELPFLCRSVVSRVFRHRILWPLPARYFIRVVAEQRPVEHNCLRLHEEKDRYGNQRLAMSWTVSEDDMSTFRVFADRFSSFWLRSPLITIGTLRQLPAPYEVDAFLHPAGTTRMGVSRRTSVVAPDLSVHAIRNLYIASTSVFPSSGSANPTMTLLQLVCRLAVRLSQKVVADGPPVMLCGYGQGARKELSDISERNITA